MRKLCNGIFVAPGDDLIAIPVRKKDKIDVGQSCIKQRSDRFGLKKMGSQSILTITIRL